LRWAGAAVVTAVATLPLVPGHDAITCPLRAATGVPCPFCGMTRGIGDVLRGDVGGALAHNPGSVVLVAGFVALLVAWRPRTVRVPTWALATAVAALWTFQLVKLATGRPL
jgi:hypothetical protein